MRGWSEGSRAADRRGFVLPAVIFALVILTILAVVAFRTSDDERRAARALRESAVALYAAEAGLRSTLGAWPTSPVQALKPGDSLNLGRQPLPNKASHRTVIHRVDNGGLQVYAVVVEGRGGGPLGGQSTLTQVVTALPTFKWGIFTENGITISGGTGTDGYNSNAGPYYAPKADSTGSLATNGSVVLNGGTSRVKGDVAAVGTVSKYGATVTGTTTSGAPPFPVMPVIPCPTGGYTQDVPRGPGISYDPRTGVLRVSGGGKNITLPAPPTQYYFSQVVLTGGAKLVINGAGQHVDIYIDNVLSVSGGGVVNSGAMPTQLGIWACGSPANPAKWDLTGGSGSYYSLYAPNHDVAVSGSSDLYGAIVAASLTASGGTQFHYDEALAQQPSDRVAILTGSWAQISN